MLYDFVVIGGGIVGAATARQLLEEYPGAAVLLLDKERGPARHQTGRNSGVIHAGVYYAPGSLKAQFCKAGAAATIAFCREHGLPWQQCGKLLVATSAAEMERMRELFARCRAHGIDSTWLDAAQLRELEPNIAGDGAIRVPATGMTDYAAICRKLIELFVAAGGVVQLDAEVSTLVEHSDRIHIGTSSAEFESKFLIVCAGVMADRLVRMQGLTADFCMVPFRGEYFRLRENMHIGIQHHIYPIPDPALPFLGIHLTRTIDGSITIGPNAVMAPGREAYTAAQASVRDMAEIAAFPGFWRLLPQYWRAGATEFRNSWFSSAYLREAQKYCPQLTLQDLRPHPAGIRAQAVTRNGQLVHDFLFVESRRSVHVCNAPSPAATSALPIARYIAERIPRHFSVI
jgi:L-2-hydroxyglutarate oxidase